MGGPLGAIIGRYPSAAAGAGVGDEDELGGGGGGAAAGSIIRHNRRCRDIAFLVIFAAFWVAMIVNSSFGFNQGNPLRSDSPAHSFLPLRICAPALLASSFTPASLPLVKMPDFEKYSAFRVREDQISVGLNGNFGLGTATKKY